MERRRALHLVGDCSQRRVGGRESRGERREVQTPHNREVERDKRELSIKKNETILTSTFFVNMSLFSDTRSRLLKVGDRAESRFSYPVETRTAKLARGEVSRQPFVFDTREGVAPFIDIVAQSPSVSPREGHIFEEKEGPDRRMSEENTVIARPVWQSFVVCLMTHFPHMGEDLAPAMDLGTTPPVRVIMTSEGIEFLNQFIQTWYEGGVEIGTVEVWREGDMPMEATQEVQYLLPFRPVTGLNVIVTPTIQRTLDPRERVILREKTKFGADEGLEGIGRFLRVCVFECLIPGKSRRRQEPRAEVKRRRWRGGWVRGGKGE
jgi:hypothetical protein